VVELGEVAAEVKSGDEFEHACGHEEHQAGDHKKAKGVGRVGVHHDRNAVVEEGDGKQNADGPAQPGIDVAESIEQPTEKKGSESVRDGREPLGESVTAMKSAADRFGEGSVDDDHQKRRQKLKGLENDRLADGEFSDVIGFALPFAPMHQTPTFAKGSDEHDGEEIRDENVKDSAAGIDDAFPGPGGRKDQEQSVKQVREMAE